MKKSLITLGAISLAFAGVAAGLVGAGNQAEAVEATNANDVTFCLVPNSNWNTANARFALYYFGSGEANNGWVSMTLINGSTNYYVATPSATYDITTLIFCRMNPANNTNSWANKWDQTDNLTYDGAKACFTMTSGSWTAGEWSALSIYSVTEYAVVDATKEESVLATEKAYSVTSFVPSTPAVRTGKAFQGWYTDEACNTAYTAASISADTTLYAKYTTASTVKTAYFTKTGWDNCYVYTFGGAQGGEFGAWPGTKITTHTDGATLNEVGAVYKAEYHSEYGDTGVIFNDGTVTGAVVGTNKTNDLTLADGVCFKIGDASTGDADLGKAAKVVYDINVARNAVTASGSILSASLCGISKELATSLLAEYDALAATPKGYVDASTDNTYNYQDTSKTVDVGFPAIVAELRILAASTPGVGTTSKLVSDYSIWIVFGLLAVACAAGTGALVLSKRKKSR